MLLQSQIEVVIHITKAIVTSNIFEVRLARINASRDSIHVVAIRMGCGTASINFFEATTTSMRCQINFFFFACRKKDSRPLGSVALSSVQHSPKTSGGYPFSLRQGATTKFGVNLT